MYFQALNDTRLSTHRRLRLAVLGSRGSAYLRACVCAAAVRRGFILTSLASTCHLYHEMLADDESSLYAFRPDAVLLAVDPGQLIGNESLAAELPGIAKQHLGAALIQRTFLAHFPAEIDDSAPRLRSSLLDTMQTHLGARLREQHVRLSFPEERSESGVLVSWSRPPLWRRAFENAPARSDLLEGNHLGRLLAAVRGFSYDCLMLDISSQANLATGYDLEASVMTRYGGVLQNQRAGGGALRPDLFLLIDANPFGPQKSSRRNAIFTMPRSRDNE